VHRVARDRQVSASPRVRRGPLVDVLLHGGCRGEDRSAFASYDYLHVGTVLNGDWAFEGFSHLAASSATDVSGGR